MEYKVFDAIGVGLGPSNLSAAALLEPLDHIKTCFYEAKDFFTWHPGLLFPHVSLQTSYLKDLVTLADPRSPYTFLNYLFSKRRLYRFLIANFPHVTRVEFNDYYRWASENLSNVQFGTRIQAITFLNHAFHISFEHGETTARHLILGSGQIPYVPPCAQPHLGNEIFHASEFVLREPRYSGLRVAVVGGGQTGAEVVWHLLRDSRMLPRQLTWITRRSSFLPLDESAFTNELYTPAYSDYFYHLSVQQQNTLLQEQKLASDGIKIELLQDIYKRLYSLDYLEGHPTLHCLLPAHELVDLKRSNEGWHIVVRHEDWHHMIEADLVVLCTGYQGALPDYLVPLKEKISWVNNHFVVASDYSIEWEGAPSHRIYVQGMARHARGVQDPNLSLIAWRNAKIINSIVGTSVYNVEDHASTINWGFSRKEM